EAYRIDGADHTEYAEDDATVSYTTEGDVLFDSDEHTLRSDAAAELQAIADDIEQRDDDYKITVEGHTDNLTTEQSADNDELSEQREIGRASCRERWMECRDEGPVVPMS